LRAALQDAVAIRDIDQHVALSVEEPNDLQRLEEEAAPLVENALAILELSCDVNRADLAACDAGIAGVLGDAQTALHSTGLRAADMAGDTFDLRIVEAIDDDFVVGPEQPEFRADRTGSAALGPAGDPPAKQKHNQQRTGAEEKTEFPHHVLTLRAAFGADEP